jgi:hypothetical protein
MGYTPGHHEDVTVKECLTVRPNCGTIVMLTTSNGLRHMQDQFRSKVTDAGRVVIPAVYRKEVPVL